MADADRERLMAIYAAAGRIIAEDGLSDRPTIETTEDLLVFHNTLLRWLWNGDAGRSLSQYSGLRESIEKAFVDSIGTDARTLTPELRQSAVSLCRSIGGR